MDRIAIALALALTASPAFAGVQETKPATRPLQCKTLSSALQRRACRQCLKKANHRYAAAADTGVCSVEQLDEDGNILDRAGNAIGRGVESAGKAAGKAGTAIDHGINKAGKRIGDEVEKHRAHPQKPPPDEEAPVR